MSHIYAGDNIDHPDDLIVATRWSNSPEELAIALNNLGTFNWMKLGRSLSRNNIPSYREKFMRRDLLYISKRMSSKAVNGEDMRHLSNEEVSLLQESLSLWDDAVKECLNDQDSSINAKQVRFL